MCGLCPPGLPPVADAPPFRPVHPLAAIRQAIAKSVVSYYQKCARLHPCCPRVAAALDSPPLKRQGRVCERGGQAPRAAASVARCPRRASPCRRRADAPPIACSLACSQTWMRLRRRRSRRSSSRTTAACSSPTRADASRRSSAAPALAPAAKSRTVKRRCGGRSHAPRVLLSRVHFAMLSAPGGEIDESARDEARWTVVLYRVRNSGACDSKARGDSASCYGNSLVSRLHVCDASCSVALLGFDTAHALI